MRAIKSPRVVALTGTMPSPPTSVPGVSTIARAVGRLSREAARHGDMGVSSAQTIAYRTAMMAGAGLDPFRLSDPEFTRMVTEKVDAVSEGARAMALVWPNLMSAWMGWMMAPASPRAAARWMNAIATTSSRTTRPFQRRADANARRLGKSGV